MCLAKGYLMLYIPWVEFQFCIHYIQLPFEKKILASMISKGGQDSGNAPPPSLNETLTIVHRHTLYYLKHSVKHICMMTDR